MGTKIPILADAFFVVTGMVLGLGVFVSASIPVMNYFDELGKIWLGLVLILAALLAYAGLYLWIFFRIHRGIRPELRGLRVTFAFVGPALAGSLCFQILPMLTDTRFMDQSTGWRVVFLGGVAVALIALYSSLMLATLRWPEKMKHASRILFFLAFSLPAILESTARFLGA